MAALLGGLFLVKIPPAPEELSREAMEFITVNTLSMWFGWAILGTAAIGLVISVWSLVRKKYTGLILLAMVLYSPIAWFNMAVSSIGTFADEDFVRDRNGAEYHLLNGSFLQGQDYVIGKLRSREGFKTRFQVLARSGGYAESGYLGIVRPEGPSGERRLYLNAHHQLVGVSYGNVACMAYDLTTGIEYLGGLDRSNFAKTNQRLIRDLSPFLVLGPEDAPRSSDFHTLLDPLGFGRPVIAAVSTDLLNPNPRVRQLARKLAEDLHAHPPG